MKATSSLFRLTRAIAVGTAGAAAIGLAGHALAQQAEKTPPTKAQRTIEYRQSALYLLGWNIGPIAGMVKGEIPFDAKAVELRAMRLAQIAPMIAEGFPDDSQTGAPTKAKPEIWQNMDDFRSKATTLEQVTAKFAATARSGDPKLVAAGLAEVGNACKACHEKYKAD
jgi:cytochrome c556